MVKNFYNVNTNQLIDELQAEGILECTEMAFFPDEDTLSIRFKDIKEIKTPIYEQIESEEVQDEFINGEQTDEAITYTIRSSENVSYEVMVSIAETNDVLDADGNQTFDEDGNVATEIVLVDKVETKYKDVETWVDYDPTQLFADIQTVVDVHDKLKGIKEEKITEFKEKCGEEIEFGFDSTCFDGETFKHYSLTSNDQTNILGSAMKVSMGITPTYKWDDYVGICFNWTAEQMMTLVTKMGEYITEIRDKYAILKKSVLDATTEEEINNIEW